MDRPMRVYGANVFELVLAGWLAALGPLLLAWAVAAGIAPGALLPGEGVGGGLLAGATGAAGLALALAGAGVQQNRAALDVGVALLAATGLAWLAWGIVAGAAVPIVAGVALLALLAATLLLRRRAIIARYKPRFFSPRAFETMVAVADTMIDGDGREAIGPVQVAVNVDHLLADAEAQSKGEIKLVMLVVEWALPVLVLRPFPFSSLGGLSRRRAVEKVIGAGGMFRDVARALKVLACAGYYGDPRTMTQIGYVPYDDRARSIGVDQRPLRHPDPFDRAPVP
jgi:hypothetical protein